MPDSAPDFAADSAPDTDLSVIDAPESSRFELLLDGECVGFADYSLDGDVVTVPHVETKPAHRGQGFAAALVRGMLDSLRVTGRTIRPVCPFAAAYMRRHPDTHDLLTNARCI